MKKNENYLFPSLAMLSLIICLSTTVKGKIAKDATCKKADQTCYITVTNGKETSHSGLLKIE
ncbi:MAG: hypothetical protein HQ448_12680 [Cytophagales bacterium]|jgi:hypothetical protein|nr:hypothetical protein [Cytophagales bacterium]